MRNKLGIDLMDDKLTPMQAFQVINAPPKSFDVRLFLMTSLAWTSHLRWLGA